VNAGIPDGDIFIINETNKDIIVTVKLHEKNFIMTKDDNYVYVNFSHLNEFGLEGPFGIHDWNPVTLKPSERQSFVVYSLHTKAGMNFSKREIFEQFKAIYKDLSITDEDENELLNIDTLKSSDFIQKGSVKWALVIK
jgi:hypothetical protein